MPILWFGTGSQNIHKIIKGSNLSFETSYDKGHNISRGFIDFGKQYERNIYGKGLCDLPIATSRLCDKSEEVCVRYCTKNRVLRVDCEFSNYDFVITEKIGKIKDQCLRLYKASGFDKTNRNTFFNHSSSAPSPSTVSLLTTTANCISKTNTVLPHFGKADSHGKRELLWWVNKLEFCNGLFRQQQAHVLIRTDASNKGWGRGVRTGGQWSKKEQDLHINQLELLAIKFAILTLAKMWKMSAIHIQVDNMTALSYMLKIGEQRIQN